VSGGLFPDAAPMEWAAVVRPDRTIMVHGPISEAPRLVRESLELLNYADTKRSRPELLRSHPNPTMEAAR